jgi:hypothetical protein
MRLGRVVSWVVVLAVLFWAGYTAVGAGWSYLTAQELVDKALRDASARHRAAFATGSQTAVDTLTGTVRATILLAAARDGLRMREEDVAVSANAAGFLASVRWSYPIITYQGYDILVVPLFVQRSVSMTP